MNGLLIRHCHLIKRPIFIVICNLKFCRVSGLHKLVMWPGMTVCGLLKLHIIVSGPKAESRMLAPCWWTNHYVIEGYIESLLKLTGRASGHYCLLKIGNWMVTINYIPKNHVRNIFSATQKLCYNN